MAAVVDLAPVVLVGVADSAPEDLVGVAGSGRAAALQAVADLLLAAGSGMGRWAADSTVEAADSTEVEADSTEVEASMAAEDSTVVVVPTAEAAAGKGLLRQKGFDTAGSAGCQPFSVVQQRIAAEQKILSGRRRPQALESEGGTVIT